MTAPFDQVRRGETAVKTSADAAERLMLVHAFARLRPVALGMALGICNGVGLFVATSVLLIRGGDDPHVGAHLGLLSNYYPGYDVTWPGAFFGAGYGFATGFVVGAMLALLVNLSHALYVRRLARSARGSEISDGF